MSKKQRCPECNDWLDIASNCDCGWAFVKEKTVAAPDHRCSFKHGSMRCPYPGTRSHSILGGGIWYCSEHISNLNNPEYCLEILRNAEKNFIAVMEDRIHWSIKLIPQEFAKAKKEIRDLHLQLFKQ
jgi:hypothetical protein